MDIYLTDLETGDSLRLPLVPQEIRAHTGTVFQSFQIMAKGEIKLPIGRELTGFSWEGFLPGESRKKAPYVRAWRNPKEIETLWRVYETKGTKLRLLVTETPINHNVYIENHEMKYRGGYGDYHYSIKLLHAMSLTVSPMNKNKSQQQERPSPSQSKTYTVVKGDSLWSIAQKLMGAGSKYPQLYEANKSVIGSNPNKIYPGQVLTIPG